MSINVIYNQHLRKYPCICCYAVILTYLSRNSIVHYTSNRRIRILNPAAFLCILHHHFCLVFPFPGLYLFARSVNVCPQFLSTSTVVNPAASNASVSCRTVRGVS